MTEQAKTQLDDPVPPGAWAPKLLARLPTTERSFTLEPGEFHTGVVFVNIPRGRFPASGRMSITLRLVDDTSEFQEVEYTLLGPKR